MSNMCLPHQSDTFPYGYLFTPYPLLWLCSAIIFGCGWSIQFSGFPNTHWNQGLIANLTGLLPFVFWIEVQGTVEIAFVSCILWIVCDLAIPWNQYHRTHDDSTIVILPELVIPWVFWRRRLLRLYHPEPAHCWRQASQLLGCFVLVVVYWCDSSHLRALRLPWLCISPHLTILDRLSLQNLLIESSMSCKEVLPRYIRLRLICRGALGWKQWRCKKLWL